MNNLREKLIQFQNGMCSLAEITEHIQQEIQLPIATIDTGRKARTGYNECIWGQNKNAEELQVIIDALLQKNNDDSFLITRLSKETYSHMQNVISKHPSFLFSYYSKSRCLHIERKERSLPQKTSATKNSVGILVAGTSDLYVAEEAQITLKHCGIESKMYVDIGVAGLHRLLQRLPEIKEHSILIVVAGMEAALPSVVAGLVSSAIIAVPTSVGYGSHFEGVTALLGMLNACAPGISVVNIDNGYGAAMVVSKIVQCCTVQH